MSTSLVLNLATQASYHYANYDFTGFATQGDRQFACKVDGIYELVGDTDADAPIDAQITTGLLDFGEPALKTVTAAYLGYRASGALTLTVSVGQSGGAQTVRYGLAETPAVPVTARIKLGKGVKARYWQWQLANDAGADFELETLDLLPVVLQRRI